MRMIFRLSFSLPYNTSRIRLGGSPSQLVWIFFSFIMGFFRKAIDFIAPPPKQNDDGRDAWPSRTAFVLAAMGGAIGLGNVLRYPSQVYNNHGVSLQDYPSHFRTHSHSLGPMVYTLLHGALPRGHPSPHP
jgi:hypothetical protein